jgi:hypothetical protein
MDERRGKHFLADRIAGSEAFLQLAQLDLDKAA